MTRADQRGATAGLKAENGGAEALEKLDAGNYDQALLDMQMPMLVGLAAAEEWRRRELAKAVRVKGDGDRCFV